MTTLLKLVTAIILSLLLCRPIWAEEFTGRVIKVVDGDTIQVLHDYTPVKIRLAGIDCPEKSQAFGNQAKNFAAEQCFGKQVTVNDRGHDRYGRTIGEVILPDGNDLNHKLVQNGLAWWYRQYAPRDTELAQLEMQAREQQRGLWADRNPMPPWDFRKQERQSRQAKLR